jgi:alpha-D-xyloside xylohydrolase
VQPITRPMFHMVLPPPETVPATQLHTPDGGQGLVLEYFEGMNFEKPASRTIDTVIDHQWPEPPLGSIPPGLTSLNKFSARWTGQITASESGDHEIGVEGDDGFRMWLDDQLVVDDWKVGGARFGGHRVTLREGQTLKLRIDFFQDGGGRVLRLAWRTPALRRALAVQQGQLDQRQATLLPAGCDWFDFWNGKRHAGGRSVERSYVLDEFPLYVRAGAIVPIGPVIEYTGQSPDAPWEIRVYPGADGRFTLYEDDGETYRYERGECAMVALHWDDANRTLSIGTRKGSFPSMVARREYRVRVMAVASSAEQAKPVHYQDRALTLHFGQDMQ